MKQFLKYFALTFRFAGVSIKASFQYKKSFYIAIFAMLINDFFLLAVWIIFFAKFKTINGWTFENTQYLFSTLIIAFSIAIILFSGVLRMAEKISDGKVDTFLTQPKSVLYRMLTDDFQLSVYGDLFAGLGLLIYVGFKYGLWNFFYIPVAAIFFAWGIVVTAGTFSLFGFWIKKFGTAANNFFWTLDAPSMYPQNSIVGGVRVLFLTLVPSLWYISFSYKFVKYHSLPMLGVVILYDLTMTAIMILVYRSGIKKYESGNAIATNE